jgi:hypothetical protein
VIDLVVSFAILLSAADIDFYVLIFDLFLPPSSSGLGYQVLILETGVRLPLGVFFPTIVGKNGAGEHLNSGTGENANLRSPVQLLHCSKRDFRMPFMFENL